MTDPVDTDALRDLAARLEAPARDMLQYDDDSIRTGETMLQAVRAIRSTADEVSTLRDRLHHVEHWTVPEAIRTWKKEHAEVDRLRAELDAWEPAWRHMRDQRDKAQTTAANTRTWAEEVVSHDVGYDADAGYYSAAVAVLRILDGKDPYGEAEL